MTGKILVLGLGNDLISDDGVGILAARALARSLAGVADVVECSQSGVALLEQFLGYEKAIVLDAIKTGDVQAGAILELGPDDFDAVAAPSPHYAGLPELLALAKNLALDFPAEIAVLAVEVEDTYTIREGLTPPVARALPELIRRAEETVRAWRGDLEST